MGVKGFPTLKIVRPGKKPGRPNVEDYQGARTAKAIVEAVKDKIPNHVKRISDKTLDDWLAESNTTAKAILFTNKGTTSALLKALAVDFLGSVEVAQIRDKEVNAVSTFGVSSYPTLVLLPGGTETPIVYDGELDKPGLTKFLSQVAAPNPDPAPKASKAPKSSKKDTKKAKSASSAFSKASASHQSSDSSASQATQTAETIVDDGNPLESPNPNVVTEDSQKPIELPELPTIPLITTFQDLQAKCLNKKAGTCVLFVIATSEIEPDSMVDETTKSLSEVHHKLSSRGKTFPFYALAMPAGTQLREWMGIYGKTPVTIIAVNAKRDWVQRYNAPDFSLQSISTWIDGVKMGEHKKDPFPSHLLRNEDEDAPLEDAAAPAEPAAESSAEPIAEAVDETTDGSPAAPEPVEHEGQAPVQINVEEISPEMKEKLIQQAREAAKKPWEEHEEL